MKQTGVIAAALFLTLSLLTGCGCRNSKPAPTTEPTTLPTMTTAPTTEATTVPTTAATQATIPDGNGPLDTQTTTETEETVTGRSGGMMGDTGTGIGITGSITG